jgi:hypothetical protein
MPTGLSAAHFEPLEARTLLSAAPASDSDPATIDLMALYTPAARDAAGGTAAILNLIQRDVDYANQVLSNSQTDVKLRLAYAGSADYAESGSASTDLANLAGQSDGQLDWIHPIRDAVGADLVTLYTASRNADSGGLAFVLNDPSRADNDALGFNVVGLPNNATPGALIHEIGHNLGAAHDAPHADEPGTYPYSHGYNFTANGVKYGDIMSNADVTRIPNFSNPDVTYQGIPTGSANANNAQTIQQNAPLVAAYRSPDPSLPIASLVAAPGPKEGAASYSFTVRYTSAAALDTSTLGDGDVVVSGPYGFTQSARLVEFDQTNPQTILATYRITAPGDGWGGADNGAYAVTLAPGRALDTEGHAPAESDLGLFIAKTGVLPNFTPLKPGNWSDAVVVSTDRGTTSDSSVIYDDQNIFIDRAMQNANTGTKLSQTMYDDLYVDGVYRTTYATRPEDINPYGGVSNLDFAIGTLPAGKHTVTVLLDSHGLIDESDETDNSYTRTFTITPRVVNKPDLAPYAPTGWSSPLVISSNISATSDAATLYDDQSVYLNLAMNNAPGAGDVSTAFHTLVFVDGAQAYDWQTQAVPAGASTSMTDYNLGKLSAGSHTVRVEIDATGAVDEADESNNVISRTINVTARPVVDPGPVPPDPVPPIPVPPAKDTKPPTAKLKAAPTVARTTGLFKFTVTYDDNVAVRLKSLGSGDVLVTGPHGFKQIGKFVAATRRSDGRPITVTYSITPPGKTWDYRENGIYTISLQKNQVKDAAGNLAAAKKLGTFRVTVARPKVKFSKVKIR